MKQQVETDIKGRSIQRIKSNFSLRIAETVAKPVMTTLRAARVVDLSLASLPHIHHF